MVPAAGRIIAGKCNLLLSFDGRGGAGQEPLAAPLTPNPAGAEQTRAQVSVRGHRRARQRCTAERQQAPEGTRLQAVLHLSSLTAIPEAPQMFGFGFQEVFSEGLGCSVERNLLVVSRHLVTH